MAKILILYGTAEGQTKKIAETTGRALAAQGHQPDLNSVDGPPADEMLNGYDGFVIGSSVHLGRLNKSVRRWVRKNAYVLNAKPSAFFSVCLGILEKRPEVLREEREIVRSLFETTGWRPELTTIFAGALKFSSYGWLKRRILRRSQAARAAGRTPIGTMNTRIGPRWRNLPDG